MKKRQVPKNVAGYGNFDKRKDKSPKPKTNRRNEVLKKSCLNPKVNSSAKMISDWIRQLTLN